MNLSYKSPRAFTLVELLLALFISSLVVLAFASIIDISYRSADQGSILDPFIFFDEVRNEIVYAEEIYPSQDSKFAYKKGYPNDFGFVLRTKFKKRDGMPIKYIYFSQKGDAIVRVAVNLPMDWPIIDFNMEADGTNAIIGGVADVSGSFYNQESQLVYLEVLDQDSAEAFSTAVYSGDLE